MDPEQMSPEVMQMMMSLGGGQAPQPAEGTGGFGSALPGLPEQVPSMGNNEMPTVPPPMMEGGGMGGAMPAPADQAGMSPEVSQMVQALQAPQNPVGDGGAAVEMGAPQEGVGEGLQAQPDANMAGQWSPGTGQTPDFNAVIPPSGNANNTSW